jgi:D-alanine-D-alanine ligase
LIHDLNRLDERALQFPLFLKPSMEGSSKGIHSDCKVSTPAEFYQTARRILRETSGPILAETYLPGPEFTVGLMGEGEHARVLGVMEVVFKNNGLPPIYCYETKLAYLDCIEYRMADQGLGSRIGEAALGAWRALGCRDGGRVDLRLDEQGVPHFIEVNPLPGLHPKSSDLVILARMSGYSYFELVSGIVEQALPRLAKTRHAEDAFTQSSFEFVCGLM